MSTTTQYRNTLVLRALFITSALCFCSLSMHGQKLRYGQTLPLSKPGDDYPIKLHISGIHLRFDDTGDGGIQEIYMDAVIDGEKVDLEGGAGLPPSQFSKVKLGNYQARLVIDRHKMGDTPLLRQYDILFPDKTVWRGTVLGISE